MTEACSNSVGMDTGDGDGTVEIVYELQAGPARRRGRGRRATDSTRRDDGPTEENLDEGGLGIAIIKALSDEFEAGAASHGRGSRLRFVKLLDH